METFICQREDLERLIEEINSSEHTRVKHYISPSGNLVQRERKDDLIHIMNSIYKIKVASIWCPIYGYSLDDWYHVTLIFNEKKPKNGWFDNKYKYHWHSLSAVYLADKDTGEHLKKLHVEGYMGKPYECRTKNCKWCEPEVENKNLPWYGWGASPFQRYNNKPFYHKGRNCIPYEVHGKIDKEMYWEFCDKVLSIEAKDLNTRQIIASLQDKLIVLTEMVDNLQRKNDTYSTQQGGDKHDKIMTNTARRGQHILSLE